jgi:hypothetical protein
MLLTVGLTLEALADGTGTGTQRCSANVSVAVDFRYFFYSETMLMKFAEGFVLFPGALAAASVAD